MALTRTGRFRGVTPRLLPQLVHPDNLAGPIGEAVIAMAERVGRDAFLRQQAAILGSGPFLIVSMALCWYWVRALAKEGAPPREAPPENLDVSRELVPAAAGSVGRAGAHDGVVEPPDERDRSPDRAGRRDDPAEPAEESAR